MEPDPLIYREEVTAMLFTIADINMGIFAIIRLLGNEDDGEQEAEGNDG